MRLLKSSWAFSSATMASPTEGVACMGQPEGGLLVLLMSGHRVFLVELRLLPFFGFQHLAQVLHRIPNILKTDIQRRKAKAQDVLVDAAVTGAEVANHAACDQRLHDGKGARTLG